MRRLAEAFERRGDERVRRELACKLLVGGRVHAGVVRDLCVQGLFIETRAALRVGDRVVVSVRTPQGERFVLEAEVPHRRSVPRSLAALAAEGIGLQLVAAPPAYRRWIERGEANAR